ncbi:hypothetical protein DFP72DRAFT_1076139 [Ephemerocybe angulata]|uniref:Uncharacterized protein n=1 Tax=Ephemerocybe angulata TaxID=980116 RepID=A0A8H6HIH8_9AGAR|nr:hypothetical protein DFP72DRAFT_1076139 [Tulosesus angulatus]
MVAERGGSALSEVSASGAQVAQDTGDSQVAPQAPPEATPPQTSPLFTPRRRSFGTIAADDSTAQSTPVVSGVDEGQPKRLKEANEKEQGDGDEPMDEDGEGDGRKSDEAMDEDREGEGSEGDEAMAEGDDEDERNAGQADTGDEGEGGRQHGVRRRGVRSRPSAPSPFRHPGYRYHHTPLRADPTGPSVGHDDDEGARSPWLNRNCKMGIHAFD